MTNIRTKVFVTKLSGDEVIRTELFVTKLGGNDEGRKVVKMSNSETKVFITNLGKYNEGHLVGKWIDLPVSEEDFQEILEDIGIDGEEYEEYFITDYESELSIKIGEYENITDLSELIERVEELDEWEYKKLLAILEYDNNGLERALDDIDDYELMEGIENEYDLGYYYVNDAGIYDLDSMGNLANYIDYEAFGRDISLDECGSFVSGGYIRSW